MRKPCEKDPCPLRAPQDNPLKPPKMNPSRSALFGVLTLIPLVGCSNLPKKSDLPIEVLHAPCGVVTQVQAHSTSSELFISGSLTPHWGHRVSCVAAVSAHLRGPNGALLCEEFDQIEVSGRPHLPQKKRVRFTLSFPCEIAKVAKSAQVEFHCHPDRCE